MINDLTGRDTRVMARSAIVGFNTCVVKSNACKADKVIDIVT